MQLLIQCEATKQTELKTPQTQKSQKSQKGDYKKKVLTAQFPLTREVKWQQQQQQQQLD